MTENGTYVHIYVRLYMHKYLDIYMYTYIYIYTSIVYLYGDIYIVHIYVQYSIYCCWLEKESKSKKRGG